MKLRTDTSSLSTYETKLRDVLGLRKKLKKADWTAIHQHYQDRQGKDTGIYLNGSRIPWEKAWKEIRRYGAQSMSKGKCRWCYFHIASEDWGEVVDLQALI